MQAAFDTMVLVFGEVPNELLWITIHVYLSEFKFKFEYFYQTILKPQLIHLSSIDWNDINCNSRIQFQRFEDISTLYKAYLKVYNETSVKSKSLLQFLVLLYVTNALFNLWYAITIWILAVADYNEKYFALNSYWATYYTVTSIKYLLVAFFMIYPGMKWSDRFGTMKTDVRECINALIDNRIALSYDNVDKVRIYGSQVLCLENLNRFYRVVNENPCCYQLMGFEINKESLKFIVLGFVVSKMLSLMWNTVYLD